MFIAAHIASGLIVGKITGNYWAALLGAVAIDIDHSVSFFRHGQFKSFGKLWHAMTHERDVYGDQRNFFHNFFSLAILSGVLLFLNWEIGLAFGLGYLTHLLLDWLDGVGFYPFYPLNSYKAVGPLTYGSHAEMIFTAILLVLFFMV